MYYLGIDVHKTESAVAVVDEDGTLQAERRVSNDDLDRVASEYAGHAAALEATSNYYTIYDTLSEELEVSVVNPLKTRWIAEAKLKNDRVDAKKLAQLLRVDMVAESYVPPEPIRQQRRLVRGRKHLIEQRTDCKNEVHAVLDHHGVAIDGSPFSDEGRAQLDDLDLPSPGDLLLEQWLGLIDDINGRVKQLDREIERMAKSVPETELLMTVPGISSYSGLMIHAEIGEIDRFDEAGQVVSYAGLDPSVRESGDTRHEGSISKEGSSYLRWILVQCAQTAVHTCKDPYLSEFYWRLRDGKGKPAKVALVATARKLLVSIFHMLTNEEVYDPPGVTG